MAKVLVLYYSMYGHIETMARAVIEGAAKWMAQKLSLACTKQCRLVFEKAGGKTQTASCNPQELADTTPLFLVHLRWQHVRSNAYLPRPDGRPVGFGALYGKLASVFSSTGTGGGRNDHHIHLDDPCASRHGNCPHWLQAQELLTFHRFAAVRRGATTIAGGDGSRQPSGEELSIARYQGEYVAGLAVKLNG